MPVKTPTNQLSLNKSVTQNASHGTVIAGEAPESDEEHEILTQGSASPTFTTMKQVTAAVKKKPTEFQHKSLLHRKLRERNVWLHKDIIELVSHVISSSGKDLNSVNQNLLKSQVQVQEAVSALNALHNHSNQLNTKLLTALTSSFVPQINIPQFRFSDTEQKVT